MTNRDRQVDAAATCSWSCCFQTRERAALRPPPSASISNSVACGKRSAAQWHTTGHLTHRKAGCVGRLADIDGALIVLHIIDAVRHGLAHRILRKVMYVDTLWALAPSAPGVLVVTDQSFFLVSTLITG